VVYTAVGRRLGYPLKLVRAKAGKFGHFFVRWDHPGGERFNIEATSQGLNCYSDDHYRSGVYAVDPEVERRGCLLRSMTPREELASFLAERGCCWRETYGNLREAANALAWASAIAPHNGIYINTFKAVMKQWKDVLDSREPPGYPTMYFNWTARRFPETFPEGAERALLQLEAMETILNNRAWDARMSPPSFIHLSRREGVSQEARARIPVGRSKQGSLLSRACMA
jgi:hypothetical protein